MQVADSGLITVNQSLNSRDRGLSEIASGVQNRVDNAAPAFLADQLNMQTAGFSQGITNGNEGIAMMQVADGAGMQLNENLEHLSVLSLQYQNGTLGSDNRAILQQEFDAVIESMQDIMDTTSFNSQALFGSELSFNVGDSTVSASIPTLELSTLDITDLGTMEAFSQELNSVSSEIGATTKALESSTRNIFATMSNSAAAASQMSETDFAKAIMDLNQNNFQMEASTIAQAHKTTQMQQNIQTLLG